ncbi:MAG: acetate--CoA ligase [Schleiferiaceae bacterium]|jgi:acetyl-CoA synthetase|nr:acetate--CoA ligase [Schleiferiaceae bacterium]MDG1918136.1 acetate--CoA ligase [Schleiferiaceae bacterium]MDG2110937.1 acetate--CoA ligase [Schleiferiaceae bacterium]
MDQIQLRTFSDYEKAYAASINEPVKFWEEIAAAFSWQEPWHKTLEWEFATPAVKWFQGGRLNITENCLDRHLKTQGEDIALLWEPNDPKEREVRLTYRELHSEVCRFANVLKAKGVKKGDRVAVYMPMIPELTIGVLACARIGAVHSVVFAGFSSNALADRINDSRCVCILTSDGMYRGEKALPVKATVDEALKNCASVESVIVIRRDGRNVTMVEGRDHWYHEAVVEVGTDCPAEPMDAEDMLFILYTSGSTGKPKGVVHTCGGYMVYAGYSFKNVFQYERGDVYWCTADVGWITGHSYIIYGPLLNGATTLMFEGVPTFPDAGRFWDVCDKYSVNQFYTAPTAIRALMACGDEYVDRAELGALKVIGSVGEPINAEAWHWYHDKVGRGNCPIVDTWWQTETGGIMISGLGNLSLQRPTYAGRPLPGIQPVLLDADGNEIEGDGVEGYLCIKHPWPSMLRTTYEDHERCKNVYFSNYKGYYFTGDGARREEGMYRIIGRVDDVINVSGHRFGTAEIENAINASRAVTESAVVGYPHDIKGQGIYAYVIVDKDTTDEETIRKSVISSLVAEIGPIAKPDVIQIVPGLPKTRSGKIMRRILRKIAEGDTSNLGDTSTLLDPSVVEVLKADAIALRK